MPVFEQGYRPYKGALERRSPLWPMLWTNVRTRLRWWVWVLAAVLLFYPHLVWGVMVFVLTAGSSLLGIPTPAGLAGGPPTVAYAARNPLNPDAIFSMLQSESAAGALALYWTVLEQSMLANVVLPAVACGGILANDRTTRAMEFYFARPVGRVHYLLSKLLAVACFSALVTTLPTLLIWGETVAFHSDSSFLLRTWMAPFSIVLAGAVYAFWIASVVTALSSLLRRPVLVGVITIFGTFLLQFLAFLVAETTQDRSWRMLDPKYALGGWTAPLFGLDLPEWLATPWLALPAVGAPALLVLLVWRRVRAVEVST